METTAAAILLEPLDAGGLTASLDDLVQLLRSCVHGGASIGFLAPLPDGEAIEYWSALGPQIQSGARAVLVAREGGGGRIVGSGQLAFESRRNGRHRAEVCKVMVLPTHRRRGIAARLMGELERLARERSIRLLFLDTSEGPGGARSFYETLGYTYAGGIPDYALDPDGRPAKNAIFFKTLGETS
jgi:ribosomal protein S18 acetylase RimI-like enzyme